MRFDDDDEELNKETEPEEEEIELTFQQTKFVTEFFSCNGNKAEAAKRAGYSASSDEKYAVVGRNLYKNRNVRKAIDQIWRKTSTPQMTFERFVEMSKTSMEDFISIKEDGSWAWDLNKAKELGVLSAIQELENTKEGTKIKLYSAFESLKIVAKIQGLMEERIKIQLGLENIIRSLSPELRDAVLLELTGTIGEKALPAYIEEVRDE